MVHRDLFPLFDMCKFIDAPIFRPEKSESPAAPPPKKKKAIGYQFGSFSNW